MEKVIIVGAGGHAAEIRDYFYYYNNDAGTTAFDVIGFIDDNPENHEHYKYSEAYLGDIQNHEINPDASYVMGIANIKFRRVIAEKLMGKGAKFISFIHPLATISPSAIIGTGCVISHNVSIGPKAVLGDFNILNSRCTIGHDTTVGEYNFIGPQVVFSGFTKIGNDNMFGVNAATIPGISIGNRNIVAAGMILDKNVEDDSTIFHRFKEKVIISKT